MYVCVMANVLKPETNTCDSRKIDYCVWLDGLVVVLYIAVFGSLVFRIAVALLLQPVLKLFPLDFIVPVRFLWSSPVLVSWLCGWLLWVKCLPSLWLNRAVFPLVPSDTLLLLGQVD